MALQQRKLHIIIILSVLMSLLTGPALEYCDHLVSPHCPEDCLCFSCQAVTVNSLIIEGHIQCNSTIMLASTLSAPVSPYVSDIFHPPNFF